MKNMFSVFIFDKEDYEKVKKDVWIENWHNLRLFSCLAVIAFAIMSVVSMSSLSIERNLRLYIIYGFVSLLFYCVSYSKNNSIKMKELVVYSFFVVLLSFGIVMGTIIFPENLTVSYVVLMIAMPLMFTARAYILNMIVLLSIVIYIGLAYCTQDDVTFTYNLLDVIPYGIISMLITSSIMRNKLQMMLYQIEVESLEEIEKESQGRISNYESFITDMVRYASSEENPDKVLEQLVQYVGEKLNSERAYIFEKNSCGTFDNTYEWCKEGVSREKNNLQNVPYEGIIEIWFQQYKKSNNIVIYDIEEYKKTSEAIYNLLKPQGVNTLVTGPIIIEGKMIGFYGVDNPPRELLGEISKIIGMMESMVSFMIRLRNNAKVLERSALFDQLTNCKNRKALEWVYKEDYDKSKSLAVVMCDLNGLKEVNDNEGHDAGDRFILSTAEVLKTVFGNEDVYRIGGDEFIALLTNITKMEFEEKLELAGNKLGTTVAIGAAYKDIMDTDFESVLKSADAQMYDNKRNFYVSKAELHR